MSPKAFKFCYFTVTQLYELYKHLQVMDTQQMKSHDYMEALKEQLILLREMQRARAEFERRVDECDRQRAQYEKKLITIQDMAPDRCLRADSVAEHSFSKTSEQRDNFNVADVYRRTYDDPDLQALADCETVEELFQRADIVLLKTTDGCKSY